jgi:hypothetical protein
MPVIFGCYALPRIAILFFEVVPYSDAAWYFNRAVALTGGQGYSEGGVATAYWPPGWSLTLALLFKVFGISMLPILIFNCCCSFVVAWLTYDLGRRIFYSELVGRVTVLFLAIYPNNFAYIPLVWTEVFYTMLLLGGCWLLVVGRSKLCLFLAGLIFGFATLVKAQSLVVIPLIYLIILLRERVTVSRCASALAKGGMVVLLSLVVILPWSIRNYRVFGEWVLISTNGGLTLLTGNNPSARGDYTPDDPLVTSIHRTVSNQLEVDKEARRRALEWVRENPGRFFALFPLKIFRLWAPDGEAEWWFQAGYKNYERYAGWFRSIRYLNQAYYVCLILGFLWAGLLLFRRNKRIPALLDWWALPYAMVLYPTVIALIFSGQSRYHYPIMPFVAMTCGWLITSLFSSYQQQMDRL